MLQLSDAICYVSTLNKDGDIKDDHDNEGDNKTKMTEKWRKKKGSFHLKCTLQGRRQRFGYVFSSVPSD